MSEQNLGSSTRSRNASNLLIIAASQLSNASKNLKSGSTNAMKSFDNGIKQLKTSMDTVVQSGLKQFRFQLKKTTEDQYRAFCLLQNSVTNSSKNLVLFSDALFKAMGVLSGSEHRLIAIDKQRQKLRKGIIANRNTERMNNSKAYGSVIIKQKRGNCNYVDRPYEPYKPPKSLTTQTGIAKKDTPTGFWGKTKQAWTGLRKEHGRFTSSTKLASKGMKKGAKGLAIGGLKMLALGAAMKVLNLLTAPFKSFLDGLTKTFGSTNRVAGALGRTLGTGFQPMVNDINQFLITEFLPVMQRWANKIKIAYYAWKAFWKWLKDLNWDAVLNKISGGFLGVGGMLNTALSTALSGQSWSFGSVPSAIQGLLTTDFSTQIWDIPSIPSLVLTKIKSHFTNFSWTGFNFVPTLMTNLVTSIREQDFSKMAKTFINGLTSNFDTNITPLSKTEIAGVLLQQII